jgi:hypothetical protein
MPGALTPDEDNELRRLSALSRYGELSPSAAQALDELRKRDRRTEIRPPRDVVVPAPRGTGSSSREVTGRAVRETAPSHG